MESAKIDHSKEKFGRLVLLEKIKIFDQKAQRNRTYYKCKCDCGVEKIILW